LRGTDDQGIVLHIGPNSHGCLFQLARCTAATATTSTAPTTAKGFHEFLWTGLPLLSSAAATRIRSGSDAICENLFYNGRNFIDTIIDDLNQPYLATGFNLGWAIFLINGFKEIGNQF